MKAIAMNVTSNSDNASDITSRLKSACTTVGSCAPALPHETNITGKETALSSYNNLNSAHTSYKATLDEDADVLSTLAKAFEDQDNSSAAVIEQSCPVASKDDSWTPKYKELDFGFSTAR